MSLFFHSICESHVFSVWCVCVCVQAMEVERAMSSELQALKQELQQKGSHNRPQDEELISAMREQVTTTHKTHTLYMYLSMPKPNQS